MDRYRVWEKFWWHLSFLSRNECAFKCNRNDKQTRPPPSRQSLSHILNATFFWISIDYDYRMKSFNQFLETSTIEGCSQHARPSEALEVVLTRHRDRDQIVSPVVRRGCQDGVENCHENNDMLDMYTLSHDGVMIVMIWLHFYYFLNILWWLPFCKMLSWSWNILNTERYQYCRSRQYTKILSVQPVLVGHIPEVHLVTIIFSIPLEESNQPENGHGA